MSWVPRGTGPVVGMPPSTGMATAALVCGIVGLVLFVVFVVSALALVLGLVAASQAKQHSGPGDGLGKARAGWIMGVVGVVLFAGLLTAAIGGAFDEDEISVTSLRPGDCVDLDLTAPQLDEIEQLPELPCAEAHDGEVYLVADVSIDTDEYPGEDALFAEIDAACGGQGFEQYVGAPFGSVGLSYYYLFPVADGWARGDREFVCIAIDDDLSPLTGTVRGRGD